MVGVLIGSIIGLVLGLTGAGGSVFAVPLLMLMLSLPVADAMGVALGAVSITALYGVIIRWRKRQFLFLPALLLCST
ncbi:MAG: TSUP family transporter [Pseudomonadales bacterium]|nr:TSUP family transporter [Pseudomonadales bacterium]